MIYETHDTNIKYSQVNVVKIIVTHENQKNVYTHTMG